MLDSLHVLFIMDGSGPYVWLCFFVLMFVVFLFAEKIAQAEFAYTYLTWCSRICLRSRIGPITMMRPFGILS